MPSCTSVPTRIYQANPLRCPNCGQTMKIISFIETNQPHVIEAILRHTGLWTDPKYRGPPKPYHPPAQARPSHPQLLHTRPDGNLLELDPEFLEHRRREQSETLFD